MTTFDDELERQVRDALRARASRVSVQVPLAALVAGRAASNQSAPAIAKPTPRRRAVRGVTAAAAAVLALVVTTRAVVRDERSDVRVVGPGPSTEPPSRSVIGDPRPLNERVVYRTRWGSGPQQLGFVPGDESVDANPRAIAPSQDGRTVYIADPANNRVVAVDVQTGRVVRKVEGVLADDLAVDPLSGAVYALWGESRVDRIDLDGTVETVQEGTTAGRTRRLSVVGAPSPRAGVYIQDGDRLLPIVEKRPGVLNSRPALPGWPVGENYVRLDIEEGQLRLDYLDGAGATVRRVSVGSQSGWAVAQIDDVTVAGDRLLVAVSEATPGERPTWRSRLLAFDDGGALTAVREVVAADAEWSALTKVTKDAVWALDETSTEAVLRRDDTG